MDTPHKHATLIKLWAEGFNVEFYNFITKTWEVVKEPNWVDGIVYRLQPPLNHKADASDLRFFKATSSGIEVAKASDSNLRCMFEGGTGVLLSAQVKVKFKWVNQ